MPRRGGVGVEGPTVWHISVCYAPSGSLRGDLRRRTPTLNPCYVSFPAGLTRQLSRPVSLLLFGGTGDNKKYNS